MNIPIVVSKTEFRPFLVLRPIVPGEYGLCSDARIIVDGKDKKARFKVSGFIMSTYTPDQLIESQGNILSSPLSFEIDDTYYFEHTGSHFEPMDQKPDWADCEIVSNYGK